jgi:hypothetical protein
MNNLLLIIIIIIVIVINTGYKKKEHLTLRVATETDQLRAQKYALEKMCKENGYSWKQYENEFAYDCKHTKKTCIGDSVYPTPDTSEAIPRYYEWRDGQSPDYKEVIRLESSSGILSSKMGASDNIQSGIGGDNGMCIMGLEAYRKWCEDQGFRYDSTNGQCYTTRPYCENKLLAFCNGDCFEPPVGMVLSKVFGNTIGRSVGAVAGDFINIAACQ